MLKKKLEIEKKELQRKNFQVKINSNNIQKNIVNTLLKHLGQRKLPPFTLAVLKLGQILEFRFRAGEPDFFNFEDIRKLILTEQ